MMWEKSRFNFFLIMGMGMNGTKFFISTTFVSSWQIQQVYDEKLLVLREPSHGKFCPRVKFSI